LKTPEAFGIDFTDRNFEELIWEYDLANGVATFNQDGKSGLGYLTEEIKPTIDN
jgi:hypothetical protein